MTRLSVLPILRSVVDEGPLVFGYRVWKHGRLVWFQRTQFWQRLQKSNADFWTRKRAEAWQQQSQLLIDSTRIAAFRQWAEEDEQSQWRLSLDIWAKTIVSGKIRIFDTPYQFRWDDLPWHTDWRTGHRWPLHYFRDYNFHSRDKSVAWDVKYPWELSRLSFLLPLAQMAVLTRDVCWSEQICQVVSQWESNNPLAHSVNWHPMECAMRGITLALVLQLLSAGSSMAPEQLALLLRQLTLQGEFLVRNIEYTKVRGNHYTANIVGLLVMGATLQAVYRPARRWFRLAVSQIKKEITLQYCGDGVNFEKSVAYHRLVTELFVLALIFLDHTEQKIPAHVRSVIENACKYSAAYTRPDVLSANFGDNDSARLLGFEPLPLRDHRTLIALGASHFSQPSLKAQALVSSSAIPLLLGQSGIANWHRIEASAAEEYQHWFSEGGMAVSSFAGNYLIADFGEVGLRGLGGHGHNDTFSFELVLAQRPIVVDSGCPVYTGDLDEYNRFRGSAAHNILEVDGEEMARLLDTWRISNEASPRYVRFQTSGYVDTIEGEHWGYKRLADPVVHRRRLEFDKFLGRLVCLDTLECADSHQIRRFLHFSPGLDFDLGSDSVEVFEGAKQIARVSWDTKSEARLEECYISPNYGEKLAAVRLSLCDEITGHTTLQMELTNIG